MRKKYKKTATHKHALSLLPMSLAIAMIVPALLILNTFTTKAENATAATSDTLGFSGEAPLQARTSSFVPSKEAIYTLDFKDAATAVNGNGIVNWNITDNHSEIVTEDGIGNILKIGAPTSNPWTKLLNGVEIKNPFAGKTEYVETLTEALQNNGVIFNGTLNELDNEGHLSTYNPNRTYPYPKWNNGLTISMWVKMPENPEGDAVILSFTREDPTMGTGTLYITADGTVRFVQGSENLSHRNQYVFNNYGDSPLQYPGKWVYVTLTIENDSIGVYYNGREAFGYSDYSYSIGQSSSIQFNKGFSYRESTPELRFDNYRDLLANFSAREKSVNDFRDYSKYTFLYESAETIMEFLTDKRTKLYVGGTHKDVFWGTAAYTAAAAGLMVHDISFYEYPMTADNVLESYANTTPHIIIEGGVLVQYTAHGGDAVIPNTVASIGDAAFAGCRDLTSIIIPDSVTSIGNRAFSECESLTAITIPNTVTNIGYRAFYGCSNLTSVNIPDGISNIGNMAFANCHSLTSISIPSSVTDIGYGAFYRCSSLASIHIPNGVTGIGDEAFYSCSSLTSINIPDGVMSIGNEVFSDCQSLTSIIIPNSVTSIGDWAFYGCSNLKSIDIPDNVTSIGYAAFYNCSSLTSINIPNGVTYISDMTFASCSALTNISIPNSVTGIGEGAFYNCYSLTGIIIPDNVTHIGEDAFRGCTALVDEEGFLVIRGILYDGSIASKKGNVVIPNNVISIGNGAFMGCLDLTGIIIPDSVTSIGYGAFGGCENLASIAIPDSVTSIANKAFSGCTALMDKEGLLILKGILYDGSVASKKGNVVIPGGVTGIDQYAFEGCEELTNITLPNGLTSIGDYAFSWCNNLASITLPNSLTHIGDGAFSGSSLLTSITIPNSVTYIGDAAFSRCENLTSITLPNGITSISAWTFLGCQRLTSIIIPDSVTSIGEMAFYWCMSLTSVTIPNSITHIGEGTFAACSRLASIVIPNSVTSISDWAFYEGNSSLAIYGYAGSYAENYARDNEIHFRTKCNVAGDDKVALADAQLTLKAALNIVNLSGEAFWAADVDGNKKVTLSDAQFILQVSLNIKTIPSS